MGRWNAGICKSLVMAAALMFAAGVWAAATCREYAHVGMRENVDRIKSVLGSNTTDITKIRVFVTRFEGKQYFQSNFRSEVPKSQGTRHEFPTKIWTNEAETFRQVLTNLIFAGPEAVPADVDAQIDSVLATVDVLVDRATIDQNGRPLIDMTGVRTIKLVNSSSTLQTGRLELLPLKEPPPSIVETISGCCFKGRPPGRGVAIRQMLASHRISSADAVFLNLVLDTATSRVIERNPELSSAQNRAGFDKAATWDANVDAAMRASRGKPLLILGHIENDSIVVQDRGGNSQFSISLASLRERAQREGAELFVLGCDTVEFIEDNSMALGVVGDHNSLTLATKLANVLPKVANLAELAEGLSDPSLTLVGYDRAGDSRYAGASAFAMAKGENFFARVFRLLAVR